MKPFNASLADQLRPVQRQMHEQYSYVMPVSQISVTIGPCGKNDLFAAARQEVLHWMAQRVGQPLPAEARKGKSFETEKIGAQYAAAVFLDDLAVWGGRLDDADRSIPQLTWVTEVGLKQLPDWSIAVSSRLVCTRRGLDNVVIEWSVPDIIRPIAALGPASLDSRRLAVSVEGTDSRTIRPHPWLVSVDDVPSLCDLIRDPRRRGPVIVASLPPPSTDARDASLPLDILCRRTFGAAHTAVLTGPATFRLTDEFGKEFSVFNGAVRNYRPNFNPEVDEPHQHPFATSRRIRTWDGGPSAYANFLAGSILKDTVKRSDADSDPPSFTQLRRLAAERRIRRARETNATMSERLELAETRIVELHSEREEMEETFEGVLKSTEEERDEARAKAETAIQRARNLRARLEMLEEALRQGAGPKEPEIPNVLNGFEKWCDRHLAGFVEVLPRARNAAKKSLYQDPSFLYKSLLLLRDYYVPMRRFGSGRMDAYKQACLNLNIEEARTLGGTGYGEHGDMYRVRFAGQPRLLDRHLKKGSARDARRCFRLYFFWDEDSEQAVVGWLPAHLETRKS